MFFPGFFNFIVINCAEICLIIVKLEDELQYNESDQSMPVDSDPNSNILLLVKKYKSVLLK